MCLCRRRKENILGWNAQANSCDVTLHNGSHCEWMNVIHFVLCTWCSTRSIVHVVCLDQTNERYSWVVALADHTSALCSYERANDRWYGIINDNSYARINSLINNEGINVTVINVGSIWKFTAGSDVYFATLETFFFNVREHGNSIAEFCFRTQWSEQA